MSQSGLANQKVVPVPECIHGLELASCDICTPKKVVAPPAAAPRVRAAASAPARSLKVRAPSRLHVVLSPEEFADLLADGTLTDPIYYVGPEELAWTERRRSPQALEQIVLVVSAEAVRGLDTLPFSAVQLIAVASTVTQERVRDLLGMTDAAIKVAVYPAWFTPPVD
jgi:hypothetical protein